VKILTANRLSDGRVIYAGPSGAAVDALALAERFDEAAADAALELAQARPDVFVGPYLVEVGDAGPSGRDRLKETLRATGPSVGHSLGVV
jgi:hypothetical protein